MKGTDKKTPVLWRCIVCGFIHQGETPPTDCPVCYASKEQFEKLVAEKAAR